MAALIDLNHCIHLYAYTMVILMIMYIFLMGHRIIPKHTLVKI